MSGLRPSQKEAESGLREECFANGQTFGSEKIKQTQRGRRRKVEGDRTHGSNKKNQKEGGSALIHWNGKGE